MGNPKFLPPSPTLAPWNSPGFFLRALLQQPCRRCNSQIVSLSRNIYDPKNTWKTKSLYHFVLLVDAESLGKPPLEWQEMTHTGGCESNSLPWHGSLKVRYFRLRNCQTVRASQDRPYLPDTTAGLCRDDYYCAILILVECAAYPSPCSEAFSPPNLDSHGRTPEEKRREPGWSEGKVADKSQTKHPMNE